jgi:hypothetical protein
MKALEKHPEQRWRSAQEMFSALQSAVPEAFATGVATEVGDFLSAALGERAAHRREALRRAQLAADSRPGSGAHLLLSSGSSQSASSLQALSIDQPTREPDPESRPSALLTLPAPSAHSRSPWLVIVIGLAAALAGAGVVLHGSSIRSPAATGATPSAAMVELHAPAPHVSTSASASRTETTARPNATADDSPRGMTTGASSSGQAAPVSSAAPPLTHKPSVPSNKPRARRPRNGDLIAPEYAR